MIGNDCRPKNKQKLFPLPTPAIVLNITLLAFADSCQMRSATRHALARCRAQRPCSRRFFRPDSPLVAHLPEVNGPGYGAGLGHTLSMERTFTAEDVDAFCRLTGDANTIHRAPLRQARFCCSGSWLLRAVVYRTVIDCLFFFNIFIFAIQNIICSVIAFFPSFVAFTALHFQGDPAAIVPGMLCASLFPAIIGTMIVRSLSSLPTLKLVCPHSRRSQYPQQPRFAAEDTN